MFYRWELYSTDEPFYKYKHIIKSRNTIFITGKLQFHSRQEHKNNYCAKTIFELFLHYICLIKDFRKNVFK
jgi:hypothetical protein